MRNLRHSRSRCRSSSPASAKVMARTSAGSPEPTPIASSWRRRRDAAASTWHAYLSTQGAGAVNARDRIGNGPVVQRRRPAGRAERRRAPRRHDRAGAHRQRARQAALAHREERDGQRRRRHAEPARHPDRLDSPTAVRTPTPRITPAATTRATRPPGSAQLGHSDKQGGGNGSWNSAHASRGCSQPNLVSTGGAGLFYCFAVN